MRIVEALWPGAFAWSLEFDETHQRAMHGDRVVRPGVQGRQAGFAHRHDRARCETAERGHVADELLKGCAKLVFRGAHDRRAPEFGFGALTEARDCINQCGFQFQFPDDSSDVALTLAAEHIGQLAKCRRRSAAVGLLRFSDATNEPTIFGRPVRQRPQLRGIGNRRINAGSPR